MQDIFFILLGFLIGVTISAPVIILIFTIKKFKEEIKGFYDREKEMHKIVLDMTKSYGVFLNNVKIEMENIKNSFPTPEEVAEEVLKVKLPLDNLSPEMKKKYDELNKEEKEIKSYFG